MPSLVPDTVFRGSEMRAAVRDTLPLAVQAFITGTAYGLIARQAGLSGLETCFMSLVVFAGASQFAAAGLIGLGGVNPGTILLTTLIINMRHLLYGASLAPYLKGLGLGRQALVAFGITDETYALAMHRFTAAQAGWSYLLGANAALYAAWALAAGVGASLGTIIEDPSFWGVDFIMPACFIALLVPLLKGWREAAVSLLAGALAVAGACWGEGNGSILVAALAAAVTGAGLEALCARK